MHTPLDATQRTQGRTFRQPALPPRHKMLPLCLSLALAAGGMLVAPVHAASIAPGVNTGTVSVSALTSPTGGTVVGGVGSISQNGSTTVINQVSNKLALDWLTFNVGKDATVQFNQPSFTAVALNRILDQSPSQIFGRINSNGQVFLINTHGIIFGSTAQVNVGGLVASTLDLTPTDFLANHFYLDAHGGMAGVVNHGTIAAASGGSVSLVGGSVANDGLILASYGNINLDGADRAVLDFDGNGLINIQVTGELKQRLDANAAVSNSGTLQADGGTVVLQAAAAKDLFTEVVNNSGVISAGGISTDGGTVRLVAAGGNAASSGSINVTGVHGGTAQVLSDANVAVTGSIDASGTQGGGSIRVGGGWQGGEGLQRAAVSYVGPQAVLKADATQSGNGGSVVVWSDRATGFMGNISARGGASGGRGGAAEVSSHGLLQFDGQADLRAPHGDWGQLLLDPGNVTINTSADSGQAFDGSGNLIEGATDGDSNIKVSTLVTQLGTSNVSVTAAGNIDVQKAITYAGSNNRSLTLTAGGTLSFATGAVVSATGTGKLSGVLSGAGGVTFASGSGFTTNGGSLSISSSAGAVQLGTLALGTGALSVSGTAITQAASTTITQTGSGGASTFDAGTGVLTLVNTGNNFTGAVSLSGGVTQIRDLNGLTLSSLNIGNLTATSGGALVLGSGAVGGVLDLTAITSVAVNGAITGVSNAVFATPSLSGSGSIAGTGDITGLGSSTFNLTGTTAGTYGGIAFSGFTTADATHVGGATGFDDGTRISRGMTFASATQVAGSGTIANVAGTFADDTRTSVASGISYTGFTAITGTGGAVTQVSGAFDLDTLVSATSGLDYGGFTLATLAGTGTAATIAGGGRSYALDNAVADKGSSGGISWSGFGNLDDSSGTVAFGTGGSVTGDVTAGTLDYSSYATAATFDLANAAGASTGIGGSWSGVTSVLGSGNADTITGNNQTYTLTGANAGSSGGVSWSAFEQIADSGVGTLQGTGATYVLTGANAGTVTTLLPGGFSGIGNLGDGTGTVSFASGGSLSGDVTAQTLDFASYGTGVSLDLSAATASGIGGNWSGVTTVVGSAASDTVSGSGRTYTLSGADAGQSGLVSWSAFENISDATGTLAFGAGSSLTGNAAVQALNYASYGSAVTFDLSNGAGASSGIGGSWSGVTQLTGSAGSDSLIGSNRTYVLTGVNAGHSGGVNWTSFEQIADSGTGTLQGTGATYVLSGANTGTVTTLLPGGFSGIGNVSDGTGTVNFGVAGGISGDVIAKTLDYSGYFAPVDVDLSGATATGIGGTWSGVSAILGNGLGGTIRGSGRSYTLADAVLDQGTSSGIGWSGFGNIDDATGTVHVGAGSGGVSGNITAQALDYGSYGSAVTFDLSNGAGATTGIGGLWSGVDTVTGSGNGDTVRGSNQTYTLSGSNAGTNGTIAWSGFENLQDLGTGTLVAANQTWRLSGHDQGSVDDLTGGFTGIGNLVDTGTGHFVMHQGADGDISGSLDAGSAGSIDFTGYGTAVNVSLSGAGTTGVGGSVSGIGSITASTDLGVSGTTTGALAITTVGGGNINLGALTAGSTLGIVSSGNVGQTGAVSVTGTTTINAGSHTITLGDAGNDFMGTVNLTGTTTQINDANALALGTLSTGALSATSHGALGLGHGSVGGNLIATSNNGAITEASGGLQVSGTSNLQAGSGAITLDDGANHFTGNVTAAGQGVSLTDAGNLSIASLSSGTNGTVKLTAGGTLTLPLSGIDTGTADLVLAANGGALVMPGALSGANITLSGRDGITLGSNLTSTGTTTLTANAGDILQTGGVITATTLTGSSSGSTTLGQANLIGTLSNFTAAGLAVTNAQALTLAGTVNGQSSASFTTLAGGLTLNGTLTGGTTTLQSAAGISEGASGVINATTLTGSSAGSTVLGGANAVAALGNFQAAGFTFVDGQALTVGGNVDGHASTSLTTTAGNLRINGSVSGTAVMLASAGSLTEGAGGVVTAGTLTGSSVGNTTLGGANHLTTLGSFSAANLALVNAQALTVAGPVTTTGNTGNIALTTSTGALALNAVLAGGNVALSSASALALSRNITASTLSLTSGGAITQSGGALAVAGVTTVQAGNQAVTLTNSGNDFVGAVNLAAGSTQIVDANALTLGTLATGSLTATSAGPLTLGQGTVSGNLQATSSGGGILQTGALTVTGTSKLQAAGAVALASTGNDFQGAVTASGAGITLRDTNNLALAGLTSSGNAAVDVQAGGTLTLPAAAITAGSGAITLASNGGSLSTVGAVSGGHVTLQASGDLTLASNVTGSSAVTLISGGDISQSGGVIDTGTLTGSSIGDTSLTGANLVDTLGSFSAANFALSNAQALAVSGPLTVPGALSLTTTAGGLSFGADVSAGTIALQSAADLDLTKSLVATTVSLISGGAISQSGGVIDTGTLTGSSIGNTSLTDANLVDTLGSFSAANLTFSNAQALAANGPLIVPGALTLSTTVGGLSFGTDLSAGTIALNTAADLDLTKNLTATSINLSSGGNVTQSGGVIDTGTLTGSSIGNTSLTGANLVDTLGSFSAANLTLSNAQALAVNGPLTVPGALSLTTTAGGLSFGTDLGAGTIALQSAADLDLTKNLTATSINLSSGGNITQSGGVLAASTLTGSSVGDTSLTGANRIDTLGSFSAANLTLSNAQALAVTGPLTVPGALSLTTTAGGLSFGTDLGAGTIALQSAADLDLTKNLTATSISLSSGGNITQSGGVLAASTLTGNSVGDTSLTGANLVDTLGSFSAANLTLSNAQALAVNGPLTVPGALSLTTTAGGLSFGADLSAGTIALDTAADLDLTKNLTATSISLRSGGNITQSSGLIDTGTLTGSSVGDTSLTGANLVDTLGSFSAANFALVNAQALAVTGAITTAGGTGAIALSTTSGALDVQRALSGGTIALTSAGDLALSNSIVGADVSLTSGGNISQSGGIIQATVLGGSAAGSVTLGGANKIGSLGNFSANSGLQIVNAQALDVTGAVSGGSLAQLDTSAGKLTVSGSVLADSIALAGQGGLAIAGAVDAGAGDISLSSAGGAISQGSTGSLTAGSLSGSSFGDTILTGVNQVATLGNFTTGGNFSLRDLRTLTVNSPLDIGGGSADLTLTTTGASADLILATDLQARKVTLVSGRDIKQAGSSINAATLTGSAGRDVLLAGSNRITTVGDFSAASFRLINAGNLAIGGAVNTGNGALELTTSSGRLAVDGSLAGGAVALVSAGDMALGGQLSAGTLALKAGGAITQGANGVITASSLGSQSAGSTTLEGNNHVAALGNVSASGWRFVNAEGFTVPGTVDGGSATSLTTRAGDLLIQGEVRGANTTLDSAGAITESGAGLVVADQLSGRSAGATTLGGANRIGSLGAFTAGSLNLRNAGALSVVGPVNGGSSTTLATSTGDLHIDGAITSTALRLESAGAISEGAGGVITAGTLSGRSTGATTLGTRASPIANRIDTLGNFSSPAGFSLTNGQTLTLASVDGSAFTIDAGHAELYLGVTSGDLLQSGKTPLYDGTGTFFAAGRMGTASAPIYVIGDSGQVIADVGAPPAYFYAVDRQGNILPLTGDLSFNVPTSLFFGKAQNGNGRGDAYIDPSVISANYRSFGIVPSGILLPEDQQQCQPELEDCSDE